MVLHGVVILRKGRDQLRERKGKESSIMTDKHHPCCEDERLAAQGLSLLVRIPGRNFIPYLGKAKWVG